MNTIQMMKRRFEAGEGTMAEAMRTSDVRWERVAELREKIGRGDYRVSSDALAGRLMEVMLDRRWSGAAFPG